LQTVHKLFADGYTSQEMQIYVPTWLRHSLSI
jgi:hypothetical protein